MRRRSPIAMTSVYGSCAVVSTSRCPFRPQRKHQPRRIGASLRHQQHSSRPSRHPRYRSLRQW